ncbi:MAG: ABC transporter ATP-binding protein [Candidatus Promineifilaceae bacterium]
MSTIHVHDLTKQFDDFTAVNHVSFDVAPGEILGYLGPNGSGKTTTIRMLLGLLRPTSGKATVLDLDIVTQAEAIRPQVGYMSQKFALYPDLTAAENLAFYAGVYGVKNPARRVNEVLELVGLEDRGRELVSSLSTGWRQRLGLGVALTHAPRLIFLDEPTSGVDPQARRAFWDLIYTLADQGTTIFVTTHYMDEAEYCHRLGVMFRGRLLAMGTPAQLKAEVVQGAIWEVQVEGQLGALDAAATIPGVERVSLAGERLRLVTNTAHTGETLQQAFQERGWGDAAAHPTDPTLEDVFITLSQRGREDQ